MQHSVEIVIGTETYRREVQIGDLATRAHAVERGRQELLDERSDLEDLPFLRGCVIQ